MIYKSSQSPYKDSVIIPFGIPELDELTGLGGIPTRRITEIFGMWSVGKSTIATYLAASAQRMGMEILWADSEGSFENKYAASLGVDIDGINLVISDTAEDFLNEIEEWIIGKGGRGGHENALVVLDSIGMLPPRLELEKEIGDKPPATQARLVSSFVRHMKIPILKKNIALVVLNHGYNPLNFGAAPQNSRIPEVNPKGGDNLAMAKDLSIYLQKTYIKNDDGVLQMITRSDKSKGGDFIKAKIYKNKMAGTKEMTAVFPLTFGQGIMRDWNITERALKNGVIRKEGNTYWLGKEKLCVGLPKLKEKFKEPSFVERIKELIK